MLARRSMRLKIQARAVRAAPGWRLSTSLSTALLAQPICVAWGARTHAIARQGEYHIQHCLSRPGGCSAALGAGLQRRG